MRKMSPSNRHLKEQWRNRKCTSPLTFARISSVITVWPDAYTPCSMFGTFIKQFNKAPVWLGTMACTRDPSTQKAETGGSGIQIQTKLHHEIKVSLLCRARGTNKAKFWGKCETSSVLLFSGLPWNNKLNEQEGRMCSVLYLNSGWVP